MERWIFTPAQPIWIGRLDAILNRHSPIRHVVPGHGDIMSGEAIEEINRYLHSESRRIGGRQAAYPLVESALEERDAPENAGRFNIER